MGRLGLGSDPPKRVGPRKGSHRVCYTLLSFFFLPSIVSGFVSDGALGFDRYYVTSVWWPWAGARFLCSAIYGSCVFP